MKLLVTGLDGFVGGWLERFLAGSAHANEVEVSGHDFPDLTNRGAVLAFLHECAPDAVIHLAAQSNVPRSIADPIETTKVNVLGTINLLDGLQHAGFTGRLVSVGSGDQYGHVDVEDLPITESHAQHPRNPYAASKSAAESFVLERARRGVIDAVCVRPFNHTGPFQDPRFVIPALAAQVAAIARRKSPSVIKAGDLAMARDFLDVRDVVRAYWYVLTEGVTGAVYNICSGKEVRLTDALDQLQMLAGTSATVETQPNLGRPSEQRRSVGDNNRLCSLGWRPEIEWQTTLGDVLSYWADQSTTK